MNLIHLGNEKGKSFDLEVKLMPWMSTIFGEKPMLFKEIYIHNAT